MAHDKVSFGNVPSEMASDPRLRDADGTFRDKADSIQQISDYGFDIGGPILKDKLWFYGTWGKQDIRLVRLNGTPDKTLLNSYNLKLNWQAASNTMVSGFYFVGAKQKFGRDPGFGVAPTASFAWDQDNEFTEAACRAASGSCRSTTPSRPTSSFRQGRVLRHRLLADAPRRPGRLVDDRLRLRRGHRLLSEVPRGAAAEERHRRRQLLLRAMSGQNELKFGFAWRDYKTVSGYKLGGNQLVGYLETETGGTVEVARSDVYEYTGKYISAYAGDMFSKDRFTLNLGLRWDLQTADQLAGDGGRQRQLPEPAAGSRVRRQQRQHDRVEHPVAARGDELCAHRIAQDRPARLRRPLWQPVGLR